VPYNFGFRVKAIVTPSCGQVNILCLYFVASFDQRSAAICWWVVEILRFAAFMRFIEKEEICLTSLLAIDNLHAHADLDTRISEQVWENFS